MSPRSHSKLCLSPFLGLKQTAYGKFSPCCSLACNWEVPHKNIKEKINSSEFKALRADFLAGKEPETCRRCWNEEMALKKSQREVYLQEHPELEKLIHNGEWQRGPAILSIDLSNLCNYACKICNVSYSTKFNAELEEGKRLKPTEISDEEVQDILANSENLVKIEFFGGEPMLNKSHTQLLQGLVENKKSQDITLFYSTNGSVLPTTELMSYWESFKEIKISISVDGIFANYEYLRWPGQFSNLQKNVKFYREELQQKLIALGVKFQLSSCPTLSNLNYFYIVEIHEWLIENVGFSTVNLLQDPDYLSVSNLPPRVKEACNAKILNSPFAEELGFLISFAQQKDFDLKLWQEFVITNNKQEIFRNSWLKTSLPEFWNLIQEDYSQVLNNQVK